MADITTPPAAPEAQVTPPAGAPAAPVTPAAFEVPQAYANEPWAQNIKSSADLWKEHQNAQALIGRPKVAVPAANATDEEKQAFRKELLTKHLGAPTDPAGYDLGKPKEGFNRDPAVADRFKAKFAALNVPLDMAREIMAEADAINTEEEKAMQAFMDKEGAEFNKYMTDTYGASRDVAMQGARTLLEAHVPAKLKNQVALLKGQELAVLAATVDAVVKQFTGKSGFNTTGTGGSGNLQTPGDKDGILAAQRQLMADPAFYDTRHPKHAVLREQYMTLRGSLAEMLAPAKK